MGKEEATFQIAKRGMFHTATPHTKDVKVLNKNDYFKLNQNMAGKGAGDVCFYLNQEQPAPIKVINLDTSNIKTFDQQREFLGSLTGFLN